MGTDTNRVHEPPATDRVAVAPGPAATRTLPRKRGGTEPHGQQEERMGANKGQGSEGVRAETRRERPTCPGGARSREDLRVANPSREPGRGKTLVKPNSPRSAGEQVRVGGERPKGRRARRMAVHKWSLQSSSPRAANTTARGSLAHEQETRKQNPLGYNCLLYTSDAADE